MRCARCTTPCNLGPLIFLNQFIALIYPHDGDNNAGDVDDDGGSDDFNGLISLTLLMGHSVDLPPPLASLNKDVSLASGELIRLILMGLSCVWSVRLCLCVCVCLKARVCVFVFVCVQHHCAHMNVLEENGST